ncbi:MAG: hypothetical protein J1F63_00340 [Oscillospiraceae bacterium]|nr:hypothetical protein [Oscillospiraceae bacterium]
MEKMTKAEAIANHRKMWNWIADETEKRQRCVSKDEYFYTVDIANRPHQRCYCCEYSAQNGILPFPEYDCGLCPVVWPFGGLCCTPDEDGLYDCWCRTYGLDWQLAAELARQIAELPEREG